MLKKNTILTLGLVLVGQHANSMSYLRRLSPAVVGATVTYANYFSKPVKCGAEETDFRTVQSEHLDLINSIHPTHKPLMKEFGKRTAKDHNVVLDYTDIYDTPEAIENLKKAGVNFENAKWMGTPLLWKESLDPETFAAAIEAGAGFDTEYRGGSSNGITPLYQQLSYFEDAVVRGDETAKNNALKKIEILLSKGAKPKTPDWGYSPLSMPLSVKPVYNSILQDSIEDSINIELFRKLLAAGANAKETNKVGCNVLHDLADSNYLIRPTISESEKTEVVTTLLNKGANPWARNRTGDSPISLAKKNMDNSENESERTAYGNFITTGARYQRCSIKRPFEKNITKLSPEETIKQATQGWLRTCTNEGK